VRGEVIYPWGVAEGRRLGLLEHVAPAVTELRAWNTTIDPLPGRRRDLPATTPVGEPALAFHHPEVQALLLAAAEAAGARVVRGAAVVGAEPGAQPADVAREAAARREARHTARRGVVRLAGRFGVVAAGRGPAVGPAAGSAVERAPGARVLAGALVAGAGVPAGDGHVYMRPGGGELGMSMNVGGGRHRVYAGYHL